MMPQAKPNLRLMPRRHSSFARTLMPPPASYLAAMRVWCKRHWPFLSLLGGLSGGCANPPTQTENPLQTESTADTEDGDRDAAASGSTSGATGSTAQTSTKTSVSSLSAPLDAGAETRPKPSRPPVIGEKFAIDSGLGGNIPLILGSDGFPFPHFADAGQTTSAPTVSATTADSSAEPPDSGASDADAQATALSDAASDSSLGPAESCSTCEQPTNPCLQAECDPASGECSTVVRLGAVCDDDNACTTGDQCDAQGRCGGVNVDCSASDGVCVIGQCEPETGACHAVPKAANSACSDGSPCTTNDACDGQGSCVGVARDCSSLSTQCSVGSCNAQTGACEATVTVGAQCNDGSACTTGDTCANDGSCAGTLVDCSSLNSTCVRGVCAPQTGACQAVPDDGAACDDDDPTTVSDTCSSRVCGGFVPDNCATPAPLDLSTGHAALSLNLTSANDSFRLNPSVYYPGDCVRSPGPDVAVEIDLSGFAGSVALQASTASSDTTFDTVLALTDPACGTETVLACADDISYPDNRQSLLQVVLEPSRYILIVDGYVKASVSDVPRVAGLTVTVTQCSDNPTLCATLAAQP